jgi:molybdenum cofactor cytidylyltransferase
VIVVTGASGQEIRRTVGAPEAVFAFNRRWRSGIASSIRTGLRHIGSADSILLLLADQPFVDAPLLRRLIEALGTSGRTIAACRYSGTFGAPALFRRCWIEDLRGLRGDRGAGTLLARNKSRVAAVPFAEGAIDIDTPTDAKRWLPRVLDQPNV